MIFLTSNLPAMPLRTDLPINYRDEKSSGKRKRELIRSLAGGNRTHALSHILARAHVSASPLAGIATVLFLYLSDLQVLSPCAARPVPPPLGTDFNPHSWGAGTGLDH